MRNTFSISILVVGLLCAIGQCTKPPKWDQTYTVRGTLYIPYAEISEPFYGWYDSHSKRSRIDYYGGMVKTYQLSNEGNFGISLKLAPIAMDSYTSTEVCLQVNGTKEDAIEIQSILPNTKDFTLETTEIFNGVQCDKFVLEQTIGSKRNLYTLWVRYKPSPKYPSSRMPIPVRYEMKGYNTLLGSHYDHYYLDYDEYSHEDIDNEVFEIPEDLKCVNFPGPGQGHYATFNPMQEFVHPTSNEHVDNEFGRFLGKHNKAYKDENPATGRAADAVLAAYNASQVALRLLKPGNPNQKVTEGVQKIAESFQCKPIEGMVSHQLKQFRIDGEKTIIQNPNDAQRKEHEKVDFAVNEVYAMDVLISTGEGVAKEGDTKVSIFKKTEEVYSLKLKASRNLYSEVKAKHGSMPFNLRHFEEEAKARMGVVECVSHKVIEPFHVLYEKPTELVTQFKNTVLLLSSGPVVVTGLDFPAENYKSEHSVTDPELKELLSHAVNKTKKKNKKKAAAAAGKEGTETAAPVEVKA